MTWQVRWRIKEPVKQELRGRYGRKRNSLGVISGPYYQQRNWRQEPWALTLTPQFPIHIVFLQEQTHRYREQTGGCPERGGWQGGVGWAKQVKGIKRCQLLVLK